MGQIRLELVDAERAEVGIGTEGLRVRAVAFAEDGSTVNVSQDVDWRVSNSSYARIRDNGDGTATVTGLKAGTVKIAAVATDGSNVNAQMTISVIVPVETFYIIPSTATLFAGRTLALKVNGTPGNATYHTAPDFAWESDNESVATVDARGVVTGVSEGVAVITATSHNGIEETCTVYVTMPVGKIELSLVDAEKAEVGIGETLRVQAVAYDADGSTEKRRPGVQLAHQQLQRPHHRQRRRHRHRYRRARRHREDRRRRHRRFRSQRADGTDRLRAGHLLLHHPLDRQRQRRPHAGPQGQRHARQRYLPCPDRLHLGKQR